MVCLYGSKNDDEFSDPFPVTNRVKQGCVLAPTLFNMTFSAKMLPRMVTMVYLLGISLMGSFFNLRRLQAKSKVQTHLHARHVSLC